MASKRYHTVLSIAGSDSIAGAGIQADIKTISAIGCYACTAITTITAQNTQGVSLVEAASLKIIGEQIDAVFKDVKIDAVKTGMLYSSEIIELVAEKLDHYHAKNVVVDPVMVATSGDRLLQENAVSSYINNLFPLAAVITPNVDEAKVLLSTDEIPRNKMQETVTRMGLEYNIPVLLKGGHLAGRESKDYLFINLDTEVHQFSAPTIETINIHGTGCTMSSAIASYLAKGFALDEAVTRAKGYITSAIAHGKDYEFGSGNGPVYHFF